jgi:hypothetical protein
LRAERTALVSHRAWWEFGRPLRAGQADGHRARLREFSLPGEDDKGDATMAKPGMDLYTFVGGLLARQDGDVLREGVRVPTQAVMETEVTKLVGAILRQQDGE